MPTMADNGWSAIPIAVRIALPHMTPEAKQVIAAQYGLSVSYLERIAQFWQGFLDDLPETLETIGMMYASKAGGLKDISAEGEMPDDQPDETLTTDIAVEEPEQQVSDVVETESVAEEPEQRQDVLAERTAVTGFYVPHYPPSPTRCYDDWIEVGADDAIIIADSELPDYDHQLMRAAHAMGMRYGIKRLIIGGDFWSFDSITPWPEVVKERGDGTMQDDIQLSVDVLETAFTWFDDIYAVMGNHEHRVNRLLGGQMGPWQLVRLPSGNQVKVNIYTYMYLNTCRNRVMVVHPKNYAKTQLTIPVDLVTIEQERCDIISTHTHHCCTGFNKSGQYQMSEIGCMRDPMRTKYKQIGKSRHPQWVQGFAMLRQGVTHIFPKNTTDWDLWLGPELRKEVFGEEMPA